MGRHKVAWALITAFVIVVIIAGIAGSRAIPPEVRDPRQSIRLTGPNGAAGLAETLERFGVSVSGWERPVARLNPEDATAGTWLGILDVERAPNALDLSRALDWLEGGGGLLLAGDSRLAACLGQRARFEVRTIPMLDERLPPSRAAWEPISLDTMPTRGPIATRCRVAGWRSDTSFALLNTDSAAVVLGLRMANGARAVLLADSRLLTNRTLRDTGAGEVLIPLLLGGGLATLVVDEYDHGFGARPGLFRAAWSWVRRTPAGWAMLHLLVTGLAVLAVLGVRFGPSFDLEGRSRRSPLQHVDALGTGLERAGAADTAVELITEGLRRRLGRRGARPARSRSGRAWIDALALSARTEDARGAVRRLSETLERRGDRQQVLDAAHAVEDVWEALRPEATSGTS